MNTKEYLLSAWNWNPVVIGVCAIALAAYAVMAGFNGRLRTWCFLGAVAIFFLTLASPLNALAEGYLFSAHMLQHMLLLLIVPVLLLLGLPARDGRLRAPPWLHWLAGVGAMWIWHERTLCDLATRTPAVRDIQIISLLALGALFWWPLAGPLERQRLPPLRGVAYLFSACVACSLLGIYIAFSPAGAVCPVYLHPPNQPALLNLIRHDWGFTPARDQQTGGLLMWVPGCGIYLAAILTLLARWYGSTETLEPVGPGLLPAHPNAEEH